MPDVREQIYNLISEVDPFDKQEAQDIATIHEWIKSDEGIYRDGDQPNEKRHLCCYLALVDLGNEKVLLGKHIKSGRILPTGGHCDPGEMPSDTVKRESSEELGIDNPIILSKNGGPFFVSLIDTVGPTGGHQHADNWFLIVGDSTQQVPQTDESDREFEGGLQWWKFEQILETNEGLLGIGLHRFVRKLIAKREKE